MQTLSTAIGLDQTVDETLVQAGIAIARALECGFIEEPRFALFVVLFKGSKVGFVAFYSALTSFQEMQNNSDHFLGFVDIYHQVKLHTFSTLNGDHDLISEYAKYQSRHSDLSLP